MSTANYSGIILGYSYEDTKSNLLVALNDVANGTSSTYVATPSDVRTGAFSDGNLYTFIFLIASVVLLVLLIVLLIIYFVCYRKTLSMTEEYWKLSQAYDEAKEALLTSHPKRSNSNVGSRKGSKGPNSSMGNMRQNNNNNNSGYINNNNNNAAAGGNYYNPNGSQYNNNGLYTNPNGSQYMNNNYVGNNTNTNNNNNYYNPNSSQYNNNWNASGNNNYPNPMIPPSRQQPPPPQQPPQQQQPQPRYSTTQQQQQSPPPPLPNYAPVTNNNAAPQRPAAPANTASANTRTSPASQEHNTSPGQLTRRGSKVSFRLDQNKRMV